MLDKLLCIFCHSFTMEVSLLQIINTKKLTKSACSSTVLVQYVNRKFLQFYKGYFTNLHQMKASEIKLNIFVNFWKIFGIFFWLFRTFNLFSTIWRLLKTRSFVNLNWQSLTFLLTLSNFLTFPDFCNFLNFSWLFLTEWQPCSCLFIFLIITREIVCVYLH